MTKVIDLEGTPNPEALKFIVNQKLTQTAHSYDTAEAAKGDALAESLFSIPSVLSVFYLDSFITISKDSKTKWQELQKKVIDAIESNAKPDEKSQESSEPHPKNESNNALLEKINQVLDVNVRPALAGDGGGLEVIGLENFVLTVHYQGACGSCPSSTAGTLTSIQNLLQRMVDSRIEVKPA